MAGERLAGTAPQARRWLVVEVPGSWPREVSTADALGLAAREHVLQWLESNAPAKLLFVRRPRRAGREILVYAVDATPEHRSLRRFELASHEDLVGMDLDAQGALSDRSLVLVCGHGSRDRCCALRGTEVFGALAEELDGEDVWISSHHGGHRFAANVLVLPAGLHFGRVERGESVDLVRRALAGSIALERLRGNVAYESAVQAAEIEVRAHAGLAHVDDLAFVRRDGDAVLFATPAGREYTAIAEEREGPPVLASCGDEPAPQRAFVATVVD
jgi:hypothetical protein